MSYIEPFLNEGKINPDDIVERIEALEKIKSYAGQADEEMPEDEAAELEDLIEFRELVTDKTRAGNLADVDIRECLTGGDAVEWVDEEFGSRAQPVLDLFDAAHAVDWDKVAEHIQRKEYKSVEFGGLDLYVRIRP